MGLEVRMVPANWTHPMDENGRHVPLHGRDYESEVAEWDEEYAQWQRGLRRNYGDGPKWKPIEDDYRDMRYTDYAGRRPSPDDYMPQWPAEERTHLMMYETTSEGTPISPAFETPEELARWLAGNGASAFGSMTATYEQWLATCRSGWAPSMVASGGVLRSGVAGIGDD